MCLNNLSVYTGDYNIFHEKSLYPFHGEQAPKLISFNFDHPVPIQKVISVQSENPQLLTINQ